MALPSPSPFSLPLLSLTYINRQQRGIHASRAAARLGAHAVRPSSFGRGPSKNTYGGPFIPPAQNSNGGAPSLPYPTTQLNLRSPIPNYGQMTPKGPTLGGAFCTPILGQWASDLKSKKIGGLQFWESPILGPSGSFALFCSFGLLSISGTPGPPSHYRYPTYRPQTHLSWGKPKLNSFFSFPTPTLGAIYTKETQPMAHESYTSSTLGGTDPPHRGLVRPPSSPLHHEAKEQVRFYSTPR